ncbi:MAG: GNAT family N-acetyltransferase [Bacilli bacterium]|nr:GNAT family N-acetyltransferase [Bacilli bacterium]
MKDLTSSKNETNTKRKTITIKNVDNQIEIENFIHLHESLYQNDDYYVFPIRKEMKDMLYKRLLYKQDFEPCVAFNVYVNNIISARIYLEVFTAGPKTPLERRQAAFNYFESIDDQEVANAIFMEADKWVRSQGLDYYYGNTNPLDPDDQRGVLIDGFDSIPTIMNVYNKRYYKSLFETYGFGTNDDFYAYRLKFDKIPYQRYEIIDKLKKRYHVNVKNADKKHLESEVKDVVQIFNESLYEDDDLRVPEGDKLYELLDSWKNFLDFDLIKIARTDEGRPIGFAMIVPDFNQALIHLKGKWNIFQILRLLYYKNKITRARAMIQMVVRDYQGKGIINMMYQEYFQQLVDRGYTIIDASTIGSKNYKSRQALEKLGGELYKTFRLYDRKL